MARTNCDEIKFCVDEILKKFAIQNQARNSENIVFTKTNTNAFPSAFAVILIAFHELIVGEKKKISDYAGVKTANNLSSRIETGRRATSPEERRKNIDTVKGLIGANFVKGKPNKADLL